MNMLQGTYSFATPCLISVVGNLFAFLLHKNCFFTQTWFSILVEAENLGNFVCVLSFLCNILVDASSSSQSNPPDPWMIQRTCEINRMGTPLRIDSHGNIVNWRKHRDLIMEKKSWEMLGRFQLWVLQWTRFDGEFPISKTLSLCMVCFFLGVEKWVYVWNCGWMHFRSIRSLCLCQD